MPGTICVSVGEFGEEYENRCTKRTETGFSVSGCLGLLLLFLLLVGFFVLPMLSCAWHLFALLI